MELIELSFVGVWYRIMLGVAKLMEYDLKDDVKQERAVALKTDKLMQVMYQLDMLVNPHCVYRNHGCFFTTTQIKRPKSSQWQLPETNTELHASASLDLNQLAQSSTREVNYEASRGSA